jgi:hypothetical protein
MKGPYTGLAGHARDKSRLVSPINALRRLEKIDWFRDLLPEHLWIDLLAQRFGESGYLPMFNRLLDRLQATAGDDPVFHGYISEFALFPEDKRAAFMAANADLVKEAFFDPAGCFLAGYPDFPAAWLCAPFISDGKAPDIEEIAEVLTKSVVRLFFKMCTDPSLWSQDMAGILLRCLAETGIVFAYLSGKGTPEEFAAFRSYGEGKQKLLMLHLQDTYSGAESLQGKSPAEIARSVSDGASPEFVNIELDNWTKKSARDLALAAKFEKYYRLVYDPSSADVHGTWMSLDQSNLTRCSQPLHRFHRLPGVFEPPAYSGFVRVAHDLYAACLKIGIETLGFAPFAAVFEDLPSPSQENPT